MITNGLFKFHVQTLLTAIYTFVLIQKVQIKKKEFTI